MLTNSTEAYKAFINNKKILDVVARKLAFKPSQVEDLQQIVYLNFFKYYPTYNSDKGTIANWVLTNIKYRALRDWHNTSFNIIRLPVYVNEIQRRYKKGELTGELEKDRTILRKSGIFRIEQKHYDFIINNYCIPDRVNNVAKVHDEEVADALAYKNLKDTQLTEPEQQFDDKLFYHKVEYFLNFLPELQKRIVKLSYGIDEVKSYTSKEISVLLNLPENKVLSQKQSAIDRLNRLVKYRYNTLKTMKQNLSTNKIKYFVDNSNNKKERF